jgi:hypothetical protein
MAEMEYRGWITVPGVNIESDEADELLGALEQRHGDLGPVLSGAGGGDDVEVILSTDRDDETSAACWLYSAVADGLHRAGLGGLYPTAIKLEAVTAEERAPASA